MTREIYITREEMKRRRRLVGNRKRDILFRKTVNLFTKFWKGIKWFFGDEIDWPKSQI